MITDFKILLEPLVGFMPLDKLLDLPGVVYCFCKMGRDESRGPKQSLHTKMCRIEVCHLLPTVVSKPVIMIHSLSNSAAHIFCNGLDIIYT